MKDKAGRQLGNRAQKTRQRFLDATAKLLAERSILEISVTEIAREVDTASSLFYHYFKSVEDAARELARLASAEVPDMTALIDGSWEGEQGLQRAEALSLRRMVVAQLDGQGSYRFFFATNRDEEPGPAPIEERFGTTRAPALAFGSFDVDIEPSLGLGMLINPTEWLQNHEIQLRETRLLEQREFLARLGTVVDRSPGRALLVVVHGFREAFPSALRKTVFLVHVLDLNAAIVLFD